MKIEKRPYEIALAKRRLFTLGISTVSPWLTSSTFTETKRGPTGRTFPTTSFATKVQKTRSWICFLIQTSASFFRRCIPGDFRKAWRSSLSPASATECPKSLHPNLLCCVRMEEARIQTDHSRPAQLQKRVYWGRRR